MEADNKFILDLLENGDLKDYKGLQNKYSKQQIKDAVVTHLGFEAKTKNFISYYFGIPTELIKSNGLVARYDVNYDKGKLEIFYEEL